MFSAFYGKSALKWFSQCFWYLMFHATTKLIDKPDKDLQVAGCPANKRLLSTYMEKGESPPRSAVERVSLDVWIVVVDDTMFIDTANDKNLYLP